MKGSISIMDCSGRQLQKLFLSKRHNLLVCVLEVMTGLKQLLLTSATTVKLGFQIDILILLEELSVGFVEALL